MCWLHGLSHGLAHSRDSAGDPICVWTVSFLIGWCPTELTITSFDTPQVLYSLALVHLTSPISHATPLKVHVWLEQTCVSKQNTFPLWALDLLTCCSLGLKPSSLQPTWPIPTYSTGHSPGRSPPAILHPYQPYVKFITLMISWWWNSIPGLKFVLASGVSTFLKCTPSGGVRSVHPFTAVCSAPDTERAFRKCLVNHLLILPLNKYLLNSFVSGIVLCPKGTSGNQTNMNFDLREAHMMGSREKQAINIINK